jgi:hypothetical protein
MRVYTAFIESIHWLDEEAREAEVRARVNERLLTAFSHPCRLAEGGTFAVTFDCIEREQSVEEMLRGNPQNDQRLEAFSENSWSYDAYGRITEISPLVVDCGAIELELGYHFRDASLVGHSICVGILRLSIQLAREVDR